VLTTAEENQQHLPRLDQVHNRTHLLRTPLACS
jgi:hypothetical protein